MDLDLAGLTVVGIHPCCLMCVPDGRRSVPSNLFKLHFVNSAGHGNLPGEHDEAVLVSSLHEGFTSHASIGVLGEAGIYHGIRDSVAQLVGVATSDRLGGEHITPVRHEIRGEPRRLRTSPTNKVEPFGGLFQSGQGPDT